MTTKFFDAFSDFCSDEPHLFIPLASRLLPLMHEADMLANTNTHLKDEIKRLCEKKQKTTPAEKKALAKLASDSIIPGPAVCAPNERICVMLMELSELEMSKGDEIRKNVYRKAALAVSTYKNPITSGAVARKSISGVGQKIEEKIDKLLNTGKFTIPEMDVLSIQ